MEIVISVVHQKLKIPSNISSIVEGTQQFIKFRFDLTSDWDGFTIYAQFNQNGIAYNDVLDLERCVFLPSEIVAGKCTLTLLGTLGTESRATTNYLTLTIDENMMVSDARSTDISQTLYTQLVEKIEEYTDTVDQLEETVQAISQIIGVINISYVHHQNGIASSHWDIVHNLNFYPNVTVVDSAGTNVFGDITYISLNELTIDFSAPFKGTAYLS